jgi:hypothetical protein
MYIEKWTRHGVSGERGRGFGGKGGAQPITTLNLGGRKGEVYTAHISVLSVQR